MDVPLNVDVFCSNGQAGRTSSILLNPVSMEITHVVVKEKGEEYLVPLDQIVESTPHQVHLRCTIEQLTKMERFVRTQFLGEDELDIEGELMRSATESDANYWPYLTIEDNYLDICGQIECIPHHELAIHRGAQVQAIDGHIGSVDEFIVDPTSYHISHLVLQTGHLWGKKDITIPVSKIDRVENDIVFLEMDKESVRTLPSVKVQRGRS